MEETRSQTQKSKIGLLILAYSAFIALGSPDGLMGVAWPSIRRDFGVPIDYLGFQMFAATAGYLTSSFFSGRVMARLGVGRLLALSCFLTGAVLISYTLAPSWWVIVGLAVFAGLGSGSIDASLNTYIASEHNEGLMQWLHASYGVGITTGPIIMTAGLANYNSWRWGYTIVAIIQVTLALAFTATISMWKRDSAPAAEEKDRRLLDYKTSMRETLLQPSVWLSVLLFFIYTGVEIALGAWAYSLLTESRGIAPQAAGLVAGSYWGTFTIGRMLAGLYTRRISLDTLLRGSILTALAGALLLWWNPAPWASLAGVAVIGFAIAPIFPGLVSGTKTRVQPRYAANTIGIQLSGAGLGGAVIPALAGVIARNSSLEAVPLYLVILLGLLLALYLFATPKEAARNA